MHKWCSWLTMAGIPKKYDCFIQALLSGPYRSTAWKDLYMQFVKGSFWVNGVQRGFISENAPIAIID